jgi:hypothetical protein
MPDLIASIFHLTDMHLLVDESGQTRDDPLRRSRLLVELDRPEGSFSNGQRPSSLLSSPDPRAADASVSPDDIAALARLDFATLLSKHGARTYARSRKV